MSMELRMVNPENESFTEETEDDQPDIDLLPEYCHYRDEGCELFCSCLNCPLPRCVYEEPRGKQGWLKRLRDKKIALLYFRGHKKVSELAEKFGVSERTIQRAVKGRIIMANGNKEKKIS